MAWELPARGTFQMWPAVGWRDGRQSRAVPSPWRQPSWGPVPGAGARLWRVLKELSEQKMEGQPRVVRKGKALESCTGKWRGGLVREEEWGEAAARQGDGHQGTGAD
eukprot:gene4428-5648_t